MKVVFLKHPSRTRPGKSHFSKNVWIWIGIFLACDLILNLLWMYTVPMTKAPDEEVRIILSDYIMANGTLPNAWEEAVRIHGWGFSYALRPLLVNMIGAFNMWVVSLFTKDLWAQVLAVRFVSALSGTAMVYFAIRCAEWLRWKPCWTLMLGFVCALTPQITFLASYHNNDLFSLACVTAILYSWIRGMKENWTWPDCIRLSVSMGLTILSYYNAYPYVLFSIPIFFSTAFHRGMSSQQKAEVWKKTGVIIGLTFLIAGWWFIRNLLLYDGDMLGMKTRLIMGEQFADPELRPSTIFKPRRAGISLLELWNYFNGDPFSWSQKTFMSAIALLGTMDFLFPAQIYKFSAFVLKTGSFLFVLQYLWWLVTWMRARRSEHEVSICLLFYGMAFLSAVLVVGLSLYYSWSDDYQPQGRYIMPAFTTFALIMTAGFRFLCAQLGRLFPSPYAGLVLSSVLSFYMCASMVGMQAYAYLRISPGYLNNYPRTTRSYEAHRKLYGPPGIRSSQEAALDQAQKSQKNSEDSGLLDFSEMSAQ